MSMASAGYLHAYALRAALHRCTSLATTLHSFPLNGAQGGLNARYRKMADHRQLRPDSIIRVIIQLGHTRVPSSRCIALSRIHRYPSPNR